MTSIPILAMPDFFKKFIVKTNASGQGLSIVLMQEGRPIVFLSKALSRRNKRKSVYEKELMTIVLAFQKWWHYLLGRQFKMHMNQKSLHFLMKQQIIGHKQQKWLIKMLEFNFKIIYKSGCKNKVADSLSRNPKFVEKIMVISIGKVGDTKSIQYKVLHDEKL